MTLGLSAVPREAVPLSYGRLLQALGLALAQPSPRPEQLEPLRDALRRRLGVEGIFFVSSARAGLLWLLERVARRHPGGEVILTNYNFFAVPQAVLRAGLRPVFVDAGDTYGEPTPEAVERALTPATAALLVSHHGGHPSDMAAWQDIAVRRRLAIVEDCAHAFGASIAGRSVGTFGEGGVFSLGTSKGLCGVGGGVVATSDPGAIEELRRREAALPPPARGAAARSILAALVGKAILGPSLYPWLHPGNLAVQLLGFDLLDRLMTERARAPSARERWSTRLCSAFASLAASHLPLVDAEVARRREIARAIVGARDWQTLVLPRWRVDRHASFLILPVRAPDPHRLRRRLLIAGFDTRPDYLRPMIEDPVRYPRSVELSRTGVYLPIRANLSDERVRRLIAVLEEMDSAGHQAPGHPAKRL